MKQPLDQHKRNLANVQDYVARLRRELLRRQEEIDRLEKDILFRDGQILRAEAMGLDAFDGERFGRKLNK